MAEDSGRTLITEMNGLVLAILTLCAVFGVEIPEEASAPIIVILNVVLRMIKKKGWI